MDEHGKNKNEKIGEMLQQLNKMEGEQLGHEVPVGVDVEVNASNKEPVDGANSQKHFADMSVDSKFTDEKEETDKDNTFDIGRYTELIKSIMHIESEEHFLPEEKPYDLISMPTKDYLDATVVPILIQALEYLGTYRPPEPINALCVYLLKYRDDYERKDEKKDEDKDEEAFKLPDHLYGGGA